MLFQVPLKQLVDFERFSDLGPRGSAQKTFSFDPYTSLALTAANGSKVVYPVRLTRLNERTPSMLFEY